MIYLKSFNSHDGYDTALNGDNMEFPNVSICTDKKHVHFSEFIPIKWVDLGLPSGTLWANANLGAKSVTDYGLTYQWGGGQAYAIEELMDNPSIASSLPYKYYDEATSAYTKYNATDQEATLDAMDDMAFIKATDATHWAMTPLPEAFDELYSGTTQAEVTIDGVPCIQFTSTANSNSILFPQFIDPEHPTTPGFVDYWTGLLYGSDDYSAACLCSLPNNIIDVSRRFPAFIRPIAIIMTPNLSETLSGQAFTSETISITSFTENELNYIQYSLYKLGMGSARPPLELYLYYDDKGKYMHGQRTGYDWTIRLNALYEITSITIEQAIQPL